MNDGITTNEIMHTANLKAGKDYLTPSGLPVRVLQINGGGVIVQSLASDNRFAVPPSYRLRPFKGTAAAFELRLSPYLGPHVTTSRTMAKPKPLAPIIDALLLKGGLTMQGLVREVKRRASAACRGKDVCANIRARLYWFKRKGCRIKKNTCSQIKVVRSIGGQGRTD